MLRIQHTAIFLVQFVYARKHQTVKVEISIYEE